MPENRISGNGERFNQSDFVIVTREGTKSWQAALSSFLKIGWNKEWTYDQTKPRDLSLSSKSQYFYHSRIPSVSTEYNSKQRIKKNKNKTKQKKQALQSVFLIPKFFKRFLDY